MIPFNNTNQVFLEVYYTGGFDSKFQFFRKLFKNNFITECGHLRREIFKMKLLQ